MSDNFKVTHDFSELKPGEEYILTMKDQNVLDESEQALESVDLKNKKLQTKGEFYDDYSSTKFTKYDEKPESSFYLSQVGSLEQKASTYTKTGVDINIEKKIGSDYAAKPLKIRKKMLNQKRTREVDATELKEIEERTLLDVKDIEFEDTDLDLDKIKEFRQKIQAPSFVRNISKKVEELDESNEIVDFLETIKVQKKNKLPKVVDIVEEPMLKEIDEEEPKITDFVSEEKTTDKTNFPFEELNCRRGVANAIKTFAARGMLKDKKVNKRNKDENPLEMGDDIVDVLHRDANGVPMSQKQAFREFSYDFYNRRPGVKKMQKLKEKQDREKLIEGKDIIERSRTLKNVKKSQEKGESFVVI